MYLLVLQNQGQIPACFPRLTYYEAETFIRFQPVFRANRIMASTIPRAFPFLSDIGEQKRPTF